MSATSSGPAAVLGSSVSIVGEIISREDLSINGSVEGKIDVRDHRLVIGAGADVHADVLSREVVVVGSVTGNIFATERIELRKDSHLVGDIKTSRIGIEDGAYLKGAVDISTPESATSGRA